MIIKRIIKLSRLSALLVRKLSYSSSLSLFILVIFFSYAHNQDLAAEWRSYSTKNSLSNVLEGILAGMDKHKIKFSIQKIYHTREGKEGFVMRLWPRGNIVKILFYPAKNKIKSRKKLKGNTKDSLKSSNKDKTLIRVFTQDINDSNFFYKMMVDHLNMKEMGVFNK